MKKTILLLGIFASLIIWSGCEKIRPTVWMDYQETQCSDPWHGANSQTDTTEEKIKKFFKKEGVSIIEVEIEESSSENLITCFACHCSTIRTIKCKVKEKDIETLEAFGFQSH